MKKYKKKHTQIFKDHLWNAIVFSNNTNMLDNIMKVIKVGGYRKRLDKNKLKEIEKFN